MDYPAGTPMPKTIPATSDERVTNNIMRHTYRTLSEKEKLLMSQVKDMGLTFIRHLHLIGGTDLDSERQASRDLSLAQTHIEDAVMRAVRHITG